MMITAIVGQAGTLNFRYTANSHILAGAMTGTLQGDNNTFVVSAFGPFTIDGAAGPSLDFVYSLDKFYLGSPGNPTVTVDGSYMDIIACTTASCGGGSVLGVAAGDVVADAIGRPYIIGNSNLGGNQDFHAADWSASVAAGTPEPGTLSLGLAAAALATALSRRKRLARQ